MIIKKILKASVFTLFVLNWKISGMEKDTSYYTNTPTRIEGLLLTDLNSLPKVGGIPQINESKFEELFPMTDHKTLEHGTYVGQVRLLGSDIGHGTGTIIKIEKIGDDFIATGISALHVFVQEIIKGSNIPHAPRNKMFFQENVLRDAEIDHLAYLEIEEVIAQAVISKDICLFKGKYILNTKKEDSKEELELTELLIKFLPSITESYPTDDIDSFMYHHPLGKKQQRKNEGRADFSSRKHQIRSIWGSSGASILLKDKPTEIVAIHTGYHHSVTEINKVEYCYEGGKKIDIFAVESNGFEIIKKDELEHLEKNGLNLYNISNKKLKQHLGTFPRQNGWW